MGDRVTSMNKRLANLLRSLGFYLTRLRHASLAELLYRLGQIGTLYRVGWLARRGVIPCHVPSVSPLHVSSLTMPAFLGRVERIDVDRILACFRFTLNMDQDAIVRNDLELRQQYRPSTRSLESQADIRAIWEPARLQHVTLLIAYLRQYPEATDARPVKEFIRNEILAWLADNRFPLGAHYLSAMECGLRIPVFFYALKILDNLSTNDTEVILKGVYLHAWWIEKNLSLYSSLGNHTVCEAMGLVFAGCIFRETAAGNRWEKTGLTLLSQELPHQVLSDGGPAEQASGYHRFVLDSYWLTVNFLEGNNLRKCADLKERLLAGELFLATFCDKGGNIPALGDYDDGHALAPGLFPQRLAPVVQHIRCKTFNKSGYTVIRGCGDTLLTFDHGPLGMAPLYNHGHADALSITLSIGGTHFLVDAGTFRYNGVPAWRRYFKGTRAHNTVVIDGVDQATQVTSFVWGDPFSGHLERTADRTTGLLIEASHDGYCRLAQPVRHFRSILNKQDGSLLITDYFQGVGQHTFELNFHFNPEVKLTKHEGDWLAERNGHGMRIELTSGELHLLRGEEDPPLGWFSPAYNVKVPSPVLQIVRSGESAEVRFETRITII